MSAVCCDGISIRQLFRWGVGGCDAPAAPVAHLSRTRDLRCATMTATVQPDFCRSPHLSCFARLTYLESLPMARNPSVYN